MILIVIWFGDELKTYSHCKKIWELYIETMLPKKDYKIIFCQTVFDLDTEFHFHDNTLFVKNSFSKDQYASGLHLNDGFHWRTNGDWTTTVNNECVARQKKAFQWILDNQKNEFSHVFTTTVTSIHQVSAFSEILKFVPSKLCYAGSILEMKVEGSNTPLTFISGANTLLSIDCLEMCVSDNPIDSLGYPNDLWVGLRLIDLTRKKLPRYDVEGATVDYLPNFDVKHHILNAMSDGHFHFRVKTNGNRSLVDHLILFEIYKLIHLGYSSDLANLQNKLILD